MPNSDGLAVVGTNVAIFDPVGRILLTQRQDCGLWCMPGGMVEVGESVTACMEREVFEEIQCRISVRRLVGVYSAPNLRLTPPASAQLIVVCAVAEIVTGTPGISDEVLDVKYFPIDALPEMVPHQSQRIRQAARKGAEAALL